MSSQLNHPTKAGTFVTNHGPHAGLMSLFGSMVCFASLGLAHTATLQVAALVIGTALIIPAYVVIGIMAVSIIRTVRRRTRAARHFG